MLIPSLDRLTSYIILSLSVYLVVILFSYGFIKDLSFWRDDYASIYQTQQKTTFQFPYHGHTILFSPFYQLFHFNSSGYFILALSFYYLAGLSLNLFIYKLTNKKLIAFVSGLIFVSGYIGIDNMLSAVTAVLGNLYLLFVIVLILIYFKFLKSQKVFLYFIVLIIYIFLVHFFLTRAHNLLLFLLLAELYNIPSKINKPKITSYIFSVLRILPFILFLFWEYIIFPKSISIDQSLNPNVISNFLKLLSPEIIANFFAIVGNFILNPFLIFPDYQSTFLAKFYSGIVFFCIIFVITNLKKKAFIDKKLTLYLTANFIAAYITFYIHDPSYVEPTQRYLIFPFFFYSGLISLIITTVFFYQKKLLLKSVGTILLFALIVSNIISSRNYAQSSIEYSYNSRSFFSQLKKTVPVVDKPSLFYFDSVEDKNIKNKFDEILRVGIYPSEAALAAFYNTDMRNIKIAENSEKFDKEKKNYHNKYIFFYDSSKRLIHVSNMVDTKSYSVDLKTASSYINYPFENKIELDSNILNFKTELSPQPKGTYLLNGLLKFSSPSIHSYQPQIVKISAKFTPLITLLDKFPSMDYTKSSELDSLSLIDIHNYNKRQELFRYIKERAEFKQNILINTNNYEDENLPANAFDGNGETSWQANKKSWYEKKTAWIQIEFPVISAYAEVKWISQSKKGSPKKYQYLASKDKVNWVLLENINKKEASANSYVTDALPNISAKYLKMLITETSGDDPPNISEIELLKTRTSANPKLANYILNHPFAEILSLEEAEDVFNNLKEFQTLTVYTLSDKFSKLTSLNKSSSKIYFDNLYHIYEFYFPAGGTSLTGLVVELPNLPLRSRIESINISSGTKSYDN